jgi:hypothetical protein
MAHIHVFGTSAPSLADHLAAAARQTIHHARAAFQQNKAIFSEIPIEVTTPIANLMKGDPVLGQLFGKSVLLTSSGSGPIDATQAAAFLLERVHQGIRPEDIESSLYRLAKEGTCTLVRVQRVDGVHVEAPVQLTPDCTLMPPTSLPHSLIAGMCFVDRETGELPNTTAALVYRDTGFDPFGPPPDDAVGFKRQQELQEKVEASFDEAIELLIVASGAAPRRSWVYEYVEDPGWPLLSPGGSSLSGPLLHNVTVPFEVAQSCADLRKGKSWNGAQHIRLAIERLSTARLRNTPAEKAIELGTCMEVLLMHELAADQKTEISFKMRIRAAWLLGKSAAERATVFKLVQRLYDLRSKAVHSGTIRGSKKKGELSDHDIYAVLNEADQLCVRLIRKIVMDGPPDWNRITLGITDEPGEVPPQKSEEGLD